MNKDLLFIVESNLTPIGILMGLIWAYVVWIGIKWLKKKSDVDAIAISFFGFVLSSVCFLIAVVNGL